MQQRVASGEMQNQTLVEMLETLQLDGLESRSSTSIGEGFPSLRFAVPGFEFGGDVGEVSAGSEGRPMTTGMDA